MMARASADAPKNDDDRNGDEGLTAPPREDPSFPDGAANDADGYRRYRGQNFYPFRAHEPKRIMNVDAFSATSARRSTC
jgi:hypothetical protein